jgi:hypothetical protein
VVLSIATCQMTRITDMNHSAWTLSFFFYAQIVQNVAKPFKLCPFEMPPNSLYNILALWHNRLGTNGKTLIRLYIRDS